MAGPCAAPRPRYSTLPMILASGIWLGRVMRYLLAAALAARPSVASAESRLRPPRGISADVAAARHLFEANLDAIRRHDRAGYLACYLDSPRFALTGPT